MTEINAYAALSQGNELEPFTYDPGPLPNDQVEVEVVACGICHSDLSMIDNEWGATRYPIVPGHEAVGRIVAKGDRVTHLNVGQMVGVGWISESCTTCYPCVRGSTTSLPNRCAHNSGTSWRVC